MFDCRIRQGVHKRVGDLLDDVGPNNMCKMGVVSGRRARAGVDMTCGSRTGEITQGYGRFGSQSTRIPLLDTSRWMATPLEYSRLVPKEDSSGWCHQCSADHVGVTHGRSDIVVDDGGGDRPRFGHNANPLSYVLVSPRSCFGH